MKRISAFGATLLLLFFCASASAQSDTAQVVNFSIEEQEITLKIGESYQLHLNPANTKVRWSGGTWCFSDNPVSVVDENGMVTALRAGTSYAAAESQIGYERKTCQITVQDDGSIRKDRKTILPTSECEWTDVKFSLTNDGVFTAQGAYYGSGAQPNYLNYIISDQCIFLWFEINYEDSTKSFYPQPLTLEINDCNAQEYNVYLNNRVQNVGSQGIFVKYALSRGSSIDAPTNIESIMLEKDDGVIYNLKGQKLESVPEKGFYIKNGRIIIVK